jgi:serine protease
MLRVSRGALSLLALLPLLHAQEATSPHGIAPAPQRTVVRPALPILVDAEVCIPDRVILKLRDDRVVRLREGRLVQLEGPGDLGGLQPLLEGLQLVRYYSLPESDLARLRAEGQANLRPEDPPLADLAHYFVVRTQGADQSRRILTALLDEAVVETAYLAPRPVLHGDLTPWTPQFRQRQDYLDAAPNGVSYRSISSIVGARFQGHSLAQIEGAWTVGHEDLPKLTSSSLLTGPRMMSGWEQHGDACLGILVGARNGYGVEGMASGLNRLYVAAVGYVDAQGMTLSYDTGKAAIETAMATLKPGDVATSSFGWLINSNIHAPVDHPQACFDAVRNLTALGIHYVISAGNSNTSLEDPVYGGRYLSQALPSGALIVGASENGPLEKTPSSNYGPRVDANAWGYKVVTTGNHGDLFWPNFDERQTYTQSFAGTSSATPIVAGAVAAYVGAVEEQTGKRLTPAEVIADLRRLGTAVPVTTPIGRRVDLHQLFASRGLPDGLNIEQQGRPGGVLRTRVSGTPNDIFVLAQGILRSRFPTGANRPILVDPRFWFSMPTGVIGTNGWTDRSLPIPNDPSLGNLQFYQQAFVFTSKGLHATNSCEAWVEPVRGDGPGTPTNVRLANYGRDFVEIRWDDVANETGYVVRHATPKGVFVTSGQPAANSTSFTLKGLQPSSDYWIRLSAVNSVGESPYVELPARTRDNTAPLSPTNLQVTASGYQNVELSWQDNSSNEDAFWVSMRTMTTDWKVVARPTKDSTSVKVTQDDNNKPLVPGTRYYFRVRAVEQTTSGPVYSGYSNEQYGDTRLPEKVSSVTRTNDVPFMLNLDFVDPSTTETGFRARYRNLGATNWTWVSTIHPEINPAGNPGGTGSFSIAPLDPGTDYEVQILCFKSFTIGSTTQRYYDESAKIWTYRTRSVDIAKPDSLGVHTPQYRQLTCDWQDRSSIEDGYEVWAQMWNGTYWEPETLRGTLKDTASNVGPLRLVIDNLQPTYTYRFRVRAYKTWKNDPTGLPRYSPWSDPADGTTKDPRPAKPDSLGIKDPGLLQLTLQWQDRSDIEDGYEIHAARWVNNQLETRKQIATLTGTTSNVGPVQKVLSGLLLPGTTYRFWIRGYKKVTGITQPFYSDFGDPADGKTTVPPIVSNFWLDEITETSIRVNWTDAAKAEDGYLVQRSLNGRDPWTTIYNRTSAVSGTGSNARYTNTGLTPQKRYYYRACAYKLGGSTRYFDTSAPVKSAVTLDARPGSPSSFTYESATLRANHIKLMWKDNASNEGGFILNRRISSASKWTTFWVNAKSGTGGTQSHEFNDLVPETEYLFQVTAWRKIGSTMYYSASEPQVKVTTKPANPPAPTWVSLTAVNSETIRVKFTDNSKLEKHFEIVVRGSPSGPWTTTTAVAVGVSGTGNVITKDVSGLTKATPYWVVIRAAREVNGNWYKSDLTPVRSVTTYERQPVAPSIRGSVAGNNYISCRWTDNSLNEEYFLLQWRRQGGVWNELTRQKLIGAQAGTGNMSANISGLARNTTYEWRILAYNSKSVYPHHRGWVGPTSIKTN